MRQRNKELLKSKFRGIRQAQSHRNMQIAYIGKGDGTAPTADAPDGQVWVRKGSERGIPILVDSFATRADFPDMKVWIGENPDTERIEIVRLHGDTVQSAGAYASTLNTTIRNGDMLHGERVVMERLTNLRMYPYSGLTLGVESGYYLGTDGAWVAYEGGTVDLTAHVPSSADEKRIVLIGILYATNALTSEAVATVSLYTAPRADENIKLFEPSDIATALNAASTAGVYWIGALPLVTGQTHLQWIDQYTALGSTQSDVMGIINDMLNGTQSFNQINFESTSSLITISSGVVTVSRTYHTVAVESGTTDDLATITGTAGDYLILQAANSAHIITLKDGTGNLALDRDIELTGDTLIVLYYDGTSWRMMAGYDGRDLIPAADEDYNLGSQSIRFRRSHNLISVSNNTLPPLFDTTNGEYYDANASTYPGSFTEAAAPNVASTQSANSGYWTLYSNDANGWIYRQQTHQDIEALAANAYFSFHIYGILVRDAAFAGDVNYRFGLYADNSSAIDTTKYVRAHMQYDSAGNQWRMRSESSDGTTSNTGTWIVLDSNFLDKISFRPRVRNSATSTTRVWAGVHGTRASERELGINSYSITWGQIWMQYDLTYGGGAQTWAALSGHDFSGGS